MGRLFCVCIIYNNKFKFFIVTRLMSATILISGGCAILNLWPRVLFLTFTTAKIKFSRSMTFFADIQSNLKTLRKKIMLKRTTVVME